MRTSISTVAKRVASGIATLALAFASVTAVAPDAALAGVGRIHVKETSASGEPLPESTIVVYDNLNTVVGKSINSKGLPEFDLPSDLTDKLKPGSTYTITATADGYSFNSKKGTLLENVEATVDLVGTRTITVRLNITAEGVTDFSYVRAALYDGNNVTASAKSTATTSMDGKVEFTDVPVGADYTIMLTCPSNLAGQLPELTPLTIPADQTEDLDVDIQGTAASLDIEEQTVTEVPVPLQQYEAPVEKQTPDPEPKPVSTQPIAQTGDAVVLVTGVVIGIALIAMVVLIIRRK